MTKFNYLILVKMIVKIILVIQLINNNQFINLMFNVEKNGVFIIKLIK